MNLAIIVLESSLYNIKRLIIFLLPRIYLDYIYLVYIIWVISIIYTNVNISRIIDIKEFISYSFVFYTLIYLLEILINII